MKWAEKESENMINRYGRSKWDYNNQTNRIQNSRSTDTLINSIAITNIVLEISDGISMIVQNEGDIKPHEYFHF